MEFRRIEKKKIIRHCELVSSSEEISTIFRALNIHNLKFDMKVRNIGSILRECSVLSIQEDKVKIVSRVPLKTVLCPSLADIELLEVVSNMEITDREGDDGGRWARIILTKDSP